MTGQNPRKGVTHTVGDLSGELCDVLITALVALATITGDADTAQAALNRHITERGPRLRALTRHRSSTPATCKENAMPLAEANKINLMNLLNVNEDDAEDCTACMLADALYPAWPHGACPFHHGVNHGMYLASEGER